MSRRRLFAISLDGQRRHPLGAFHPIHCFSWHDDSLNAVMAGRTVVHETLHADVISSTAFHLTLIIDYAFDFLRQGHLFDDMVSFQESLPVAVSMLSGKPISDYRSPSVVSRASMAVRILEATRERHGQSLSVEHQAAMLMGLYRAVADCYRLEHPIATDELLANVHSYVATTQEYKIPPAFRDRLDYVQPHYEHYSRILAQLSYPLAVLTGETVTLLVYYVVYMALKLGHRGLLDQLLISLLNVLVRNAVVPHFAVRPDTGQLFLTTSRVAIRKMTSFTDPTLGPHTMDWHDDPYKYVSRGFAKKLCEDDNIPVRWFWPYWYNLICGIPAVFINAFDLVCDSEFALLERRTRDLVLEQYESLPGIRKAVDDYAHARADMFAELLQAVPRIVPALFSACLLALKDLPQSDGFPWYERTEIGVFLGIQQIGKMSVA